MRLKDFNFVDFVEEIALINWFVLLAVSSDDHQGWKSEIFGLIYFQSLIDILKFSKIFFFRIFINFIQIEHKNTGEGIKPEKVLF